MTQPTLVVTHPWLIPPPLFRPMAQELGLRDYAQFSGWVIPTPQTSAEQQQQAAGASLHADAEQQPRPLSFAEVSAAATPPPPVSFELPSPEQVAAAKADEPVVFNGITVDDSTRLDWVKENVKPHPDNR